MLPEYNPITAQKIELGRRLLYDERLSGNQTQSCESCHLQRLAFADGEHAPVGSTDEQLHRNSPGSGAAWLCSRVSAWSAFIATGAPT